MSELVLKAISNCNPWLIDSRKLSGCVSKCEGQGKSSGLLVAHRYRLKFVLPCVLLRETSQNLPVKI